ncbi:hypothetical protein CF326_g3739 [Tilletia indica]|nr:hypothetical protein CF326_g3739 [Tilletia indica]
MSDTEITAAATTPAAAAPEGTEEVKKGRREKLIRPRGKRGGIKKKHVQDKVTGKWKRTNIPVNKPKKVAAADADTAATEGGEAAPPAHATHISQFHALRKRIASPSTTAAERVKLEKELAALGGLEAYQDASLTGAGAGGGESGNWVGNALKTHVLKISEGGEAEKKEEEEEEEKKEVEKGRKLRLMDVGAIKGTAYDSFSFLDVVSIDLNPRSDKVFQANFLECEVPPHRIASSSTPPPSTDASADATTPAKKVLSQTEVAPGFDAISLSLVLNFEGDLAKRGEMLLRPHAFLRAQPTSSSEDGEEATGGYLSLILPRPCLATSRYCSEPHFTSLLTSTGWEVIHRQDSKKLTRWLCRETSGKRAVGEVGCEGDVWDTWWDGKEYGRKEIVVGVKLNNFCIKLLRNGESGEGVVAAEGSEDEEDEGESEEEEERLPLPAKKKAKVAATPARPTAQVKQKPNNGKPKPKPKRR